MFSLEIKIQTRASIYNQQNSIIAVPLFLYYNKTILMDSREIGLVSTPQRPYIQKLIKELLKVWSSKKVKDHYQNYFLAYLDTLSNTEAEEKISQEIKLTLKNNSHYFKIQQARQAHEQALILVKDAIADFKNSRIIPDNDMKLICMLLDKLRNCKLEVAEATLALNYECLQSSSQITELIEGNNFIFQQLNDDSLFFRESILSKYIHFSSQYDPFFIYHYQTARKEPTQSSNSYVDNIFNLSITKAYKYMKTQQQIIQFLSGKIPSKYSNKRSKRLHYQFIDEKNPSFKEQKISNRHLFRLQNNIYIKEKTNTDQINFREFHRTKTQASPQRYLRYIPRPILASPQSPSNKLTRLDDIRKTTQTNQNINSFTRVSSRKYSQEVDQGRKYIFKIRRKSINTSNSPISKRNLDISNKNIFDIDHKNNQYRYSHLPPDIFEKDQSQLNYMPYERFAPSHIDQHQDSNMQDPLSQKLNNISTFKLKPVIIDPPSPPSPVKSNSFGNFKLKATNMKLENIFTFLKELDINESYRNIFETGSWKTSIENNQYYLHKFYLDDKLQAISLCCALPQGDILIKYWAPMKSCDYQKSHYLFKKYLQHIQKSSTANSIYFNGLEMKQIISNDFLKQKERIYKKVRSYPKQIDSYNYFPFLSLDFSIVTVRKQVQKGILQSVILKSNKNLPFNEKQFVCFNYLLITNKIQNMYEGGFSGFSSYSANISNFKQVETKLIKQGMTECPYNTSLNIPDSNLMTIRVRNPLFSAFFLANNPYLKLIGDMIYDDQESLIVSLQLLKHNTKLYFGKGFQELSSMISVIKSKQITPLKKINYCVRMFSKRMRGRLSTISLREHLCYGDFEVVFEWVDYLKGKIQHNFDDYELFGDSQFFCIVEIQKQLVVGFMVNRQNFL